MKLSRKNASEFANIFEIRKPKLRKKKLFTYSKNMANLKHFTRQFHQA